MVDPSNITQHQLIICRTVKLKLIRIAADAATLSRLESLTEPGGWPHLVLVLAGSTLSCWRTGQIGHRS